MSVYIKKISIACAIVVFSYAFLITNVSATEDFGGIRFLDPSDLGGSSGPVTTPAPTEDTASLDTEDAANRDALEGGDRGGSESGTIDSSATVPTSGTGAGGSSGGGGGGSGGSNTYLPLETSFPAHQGGVVISSGGLQSYLQTLFQYAVAIAIVLAVIMVVIGGMEYATTDAAFQKEKGKERIKLAVQGLIFTLLAWLFLNTLNPAFKELNVNFGSGTAISGTSGTSGSSAPTGGVPAPSGASRECNDCVEISGIPVKPAGQGCLSPGPCKVNRGLLSKLQQLNSAAQSRGLSIIVNEAWPPTVAHRSACHYNGMCVDVGLSGGALYSVENVVSFCRAASSVGLPTLFESGTLAFAGRVSPCSFRGAGASHFHLPTS